jgi:hypothetical protein
MANDFIDDSEQFKLKIADWIEKTRGDAAKVMRAAVADLGRSLVFKTPVGNPDLWKHPRKGYVGGRLRGNWQFGIGSAPGGTFDAPDPGGAASIARLSAGIEGAKIGDTLYMTNNLPYAMSIEYGHSRQAPAGMVRITVEEWQIFVGDACRVVQESKT